jgi:hypothetical protein
MEWTTGSVLASIVPPPLPPTAVLIIRNLGVVDTAEVTVQVVTPSTPQANRPGCQSSEYTCQLAEALLMLGRHPWLELLVCIC